MDRQHEVMTEFVASRHRLFAYIFGFIRNAHDSEDIFQEVWLRFAKAIAEGQDIRDQAKWCRGTARNLVLHYWRDRRNDKVIADPDLLDLVDLAFEEQDASQAQDHWRARHEALTECIQELPERSRRLLHLKYIEGLSAEGLAARVAQSTSAVLMALSRLRRALRDCALRKLRLREAQS
jgi:RNA polymerase sigma-70 factor (ECF subfamily)